ncbi:MAG: DegT/DnrJ/EryC1/StrS family aminotransferase [Candidatus Peribacteraceae bacterium]|nr:DegT/DnrJ/EryC1/StrS family aminotransferase [Candidatus Peribacteraceae bacterium]MDD5074784.1 DegT/DnrJ/EryC1/StrS family aminotransferase [Candidatus Peribacteraceae bacterium]
MKTPSPIPVNVPVITPEAKRYVMDALETGWISSAGPYMKKFEEAFARMVGVKHAVLTTSGTTALHLALMSMDVGAGDEVIVPDFTMIASVFAVMYTGAKPVFVDIEPDTFNLNPLLLAAKITARTKAIMPVHLFGHSCDMDPILKIAKEKNVAVLEDAAEAHGATYHGRVCGSMGTMSAFSFYGNKIITTGEGGIVCTDDDELAERARSLHDLAHSSKKRFLHEDVGFNYRMTNLQAALGFGQLEHLEEFLEKKRHMTARYREGLQGIRGLHLPVTKDYAGNVFWMYAIRVDETFGMTRDALRTALKDRGIDTREFFLPCHSQPAVAKRFPTKESFPVSERVAQEGFYLPSGLAITDEQIDRVCDAIREIADVA